MGATFSTFGRWIFPFRRGEKTSSRSRLREIIWLIGAQPLIDVESNTPMLSGL